MKKISFALFCLIGISANAQNGIFQKVFYPQYQFQTINMISEGSNWITGGKYCSCYSPFVDKIDSSGNLLWTKIISTDSMGYGWVEKLSMDLSGNIIAAGFLQAADDVPNPAHDFIASLNPVNGSLNWIQLCQPYTPGINLLVSKTGLIYFYSQGNGTLVYDENGTYIRHYSDSLVCTALNGEVVLTNGSNNFLIADTSGNITHQYIFSDIKHLMLSDSNHYAGFYQSHLCLFDTAFQIVGQSPNTIVNYQFLNHDSYGFYFMHGEPDVTVEHYYNNLQADTLFVLNNLAQINYRTVTDMVVSNNFIGFTGNENIAPQIHSFLKTISKTGNSNPPLSVDASLQNLIITFDSLQWNTPYTEFGRVFYSASFDIKNLGVETINSVIVYYHFPYGENCVTDMHQLNYIGISLAPGNSFHDGFNSSIDINFHFYPFNFSINTCFWTAAPNSSIDADMSNNKSCSSIDGIEHLIKSNLLSVYPNPTSNEFNIQIPSGNISSLKIIDLLGREIYHQEISPTNDNIQLSGFKSGYYRIVLSGVDKIYTSGITVN